MMPVKLCFNRSIARGKTCSVSRKIPRRSTWLFLCADTWQSVAERISPAAAALCDILESIEPSSAATPGWRVCGRSLSPPAPRRSSLDGIRRGCPRRKRREETGRAAADIRCARIRVRRTGEIGTRRNDPRQHGDGHRSYLLQRTLASAERPATCESDA